MDQLQHMRDNFGSCLNHLSDEMCQMNTRIGRITHRQSRLRSFAYSPSLDPSAESSDGRDDESDDASSSDYDDEMTLSVIHHLSLVTKRGSSFDYERVVMLLGGEMDQLGEECFERCSEVLMYLSHFMYHGLVNTLHT